MRTPARSALSLLVIATACLLAMPATRSSGQGLVRRGDTVEVIVDDAPLMLHEREIARVKRGTRMDVASVTQAWIGGYVEIDGRRRMGWLKVTWVARVRPAPRPLAPQSLPR